MQAFFLAHSKLIAALVGNVVAFIAIWLASKGLGVCVVPEAGGDQACTILGFSETDITAYAMAGLNMLLVYVFPANKPSS